MMHACFKRRPERTDATNDGGSISTEGAFGTPKEGAVNLEQENGQTIDSMQVDTSSTGMNSTENDENHEEEQGQTEDIDRNINDQEYRPVEDIYAMLAVFDIRDKGFIYALIIFLGQIIILVLFIVGQLSEATSSNIFNLPVMTDSMVYLGQAFALYATVMTASDVTQSLDVFYVIYDHDIEEHFPEASKARWLLANILRGSEGLLSIIVAVLFIVQSTDNLELFQNFAAVAFVSELDNIAFYLADNGYTVVHLTSQTTKIKEKFVFKNQPRYKQRKGIQKRTSRALIVILYCFYFGCIIFLFSGFIYDQKCQSFIILFDTVVFDFFQFCEECPESWKNRTDRIVYPNFNGIYAAKRNARNNLDLTIARRPVYIQTEEAKQDRGLDKDQVREIDPLAPRGHFRYCESETAWVFVIEGVAKSTDDDDSCNWLMRSPETREYDFNLVPKEGWVIWTGLVKRAERFRIVCAECEAPYVSEESMPDINMTQESFVPNITNTKTNAFCNYHGMCSKESHSCMCEKHSGWMGVQCQICADCASYVLTSPKIPGFEEQYFYRINGVNKLPLEVHSRPAFYRGMDATSGEPNEEMHILLHTGNRYAVWNVSNQITQTEPLKVRNEIFDILSNFHSQWVLSAETVPFRSDATNQIFPFNLTWTGGESIGDGESITFELIFTCTSAQSGCSLLLD